MSIKKVKKLQNGYENLLISNRAYPHVFLLCCFGTDARCEIFLIGTRNSPKSFQKSKVRAVNSTKNYLKSLETLLFLKKKAAHRDKNVTSNRAARLF